MDRPSLEVDQAVQVSPVLLTTMLPPPRPSSAVSTLASPGGGVPDWDILPISASTGLPGMSCGSMKLMVSATQAATR